jgi:hypothetical protein
MVMVVILNDDEVVLCNNQLFAIHLVENLWLEHLCRGGSGEEPSFEKYQTIHSGTDHIDIVSNQEDCEFELFV